MRRNHCVILASMLSQLLVMGVARAEDTNEPAKTVPTPTLQAPQTTSETAEEAKNKRAAALEGSKSPWSGQLQLTYTGSSLDHPFSDEVANPSHQEPVPPVNLVGLVAIRYRFNDTTTAGLGVGVETETPFQGPKHTTASDPQLDIAKSFKLGPIHNRVDFTMAHYTSHSEADVAGDINNFDLSSESSYETAWGLTAGIALEYDYNTLKNGGTYVNSKGQTVARDPANQVINDYYFMPYLEYAINDTFNLRTIAHFTDNQTRSKDLGHYQRPDITQNFGLGVSATKAVYLYFFAASDPYAPGVKLASDTTTFGMQAIINVF